MKYIALILLFLIGCSKTPEFRVGDCIIYTSKYSEPWDAPYPIQKVTTIGKRAYRTEVLYGDTWIKDSFLTTVRFDELNYQKVECPK